MAPVARIVALKAKEYGPGSAAAVPASLQYVATLTFVRLSVRRISVHPSASVGVIVVPVPPRTVIVAIITSFACVATGAVGRMTLMLLAVLTELVAAARNAIAPIAGDAAATENTRPTSALANPRETFDVSRCDRPSRQSSSPRQTSGAMKRGEKARRVPRKALQFSTRQQRGVVANAHDSGTFATLAVETLDARRSRALGKT
jgi:hypothetical protein